MIQVRQFLFFLLRRADAGQYQTLEKPNGRGAWMARDRLV
jgi:hypothetical protein